MHSPVCLYNDTSLDCLLAVMKLLLNLTHDSELGSHRVGGQKGAMEAILSTIFQVYIAPFLDLPHFVINTI